MDIERTGSHPITESDGLLAEVVKLLATAYRPEWAYLFGSKARGDANSDSDYDILLVVADNTPAELQRSRLAYKTLWGTGIAADVVILTRSRFESSVGVPTSLPATALREGRLLLVA